VLLNLLSLFRLVSLPTADHWTPDISCYFGSYTYLGFARFFKGKNSQILMKQLQILSYKHITCLLGELIKQ
jgi:hypothetical protein